MTDDLPAPRVQTRFNPLARTLHWTMVVAVLAMLFIGVGMVASVAYYHALVSIHRPLGILILLLVIVRFINRQLRPMPPLPPTVPSGERRIAHASELLMYALMFALPLIGWGMLSAARYPIVMVGPVHLPYILPESLRTYAILRTAHSVLAYLFFFTILAHVAAILFHTLVVRDRLLARMLPAWLMKTNPPD